MGPTSINFCVLFQYFYSLHEHESKRKKKTSLSLSVHQLLVGLYINLVEPGEISIRWPYMRKDGPVKHEYFMSS